MVQHEKTSGTGKETLGEATRYDWVCFRCAWLGRMVGACREGNMQQVQVQSSQLVQVSRALCTKWSSNR